MSVTVKLANHSHGSGTTGKNNMRLAVYIKGIAYLPLRLNFTQTNTCKPIYTTMASNTKDNWSATKYDTNANFVPVLGATILGMLDPKPTETILDLGCGDGVLTKDLEKMCAHVVGVDASANMIEKAKDLGCMDARVVDGHDLAAWFDNENIEQQINGKFDAVFSNAGKQKCNAFLFNPSNMSRRRTHVENCRYIF